MYNIENNKFVLLNIFVKQTQKTPQREIEKAKKLLDNYKKEWFKMCKKLQTWDEFEKELKITSEQEEEIQFEMELIRATVEARKNKKMSQEELSQKTGLKQSAIARVENGTHSPTASTLIKILYPLGYTLKIVPIDKKNTNIKTR